jgi:hypothetical protein
LRSFCFSDVCAHSYKLNQGVESPLKENYKTLKKTPEDGKITCSWIGRINIIKMTMLPKAIYRFNIMTINIPISFLAEIEKSIVKFIWKNKRP